MRDGETPSMEYKGMHRGWRIYYDFRAPVTGQWKALRYGVGMCAHTDTALLAMIDAKARDATA